MLGFTSPSCPIGIDIGAHSVRMLQFRGKPGAAGDLSLQAACRIEFGSLSASDSTPAGRLNAAIREGLSRDKFVGKRAVIALPASALHCKSVRLPQMPDSDLQQALQWEAKDRFGFEIGDGRIVWFRAGEVRRGTEVKDELLLFAVQGETLSTHVDAATTAGLTIDAIDLAPCAAYRSAARTGSVKAAESVALLDIGYHGSQFIIIRNEQLVFYKYIDIGGAKINDAVAQKLGISVAEAAQMRSRLTTSTSSAHDPESATLVQALQDAIRPPLEELSRELDMCMRYFVVTFRGSRPEAITLAGYQATCTHLIDSLSTTLGIRVEPAQPLRGVQNLGDTARPDRSSEWDIAAGLSLYPVQNARMEAAA